MTPNQSDEPSALLERAEMALHYLERLSADSPWAHRASGLRGSLWAALQAVADQRDADFFTRLEKRVELAYWMLENAAREIPDPERNRQ
jgi:hypothetical protein